MLLTVALLPALAGLLAWLAGDDRHRTRWTVTTGALVVTLVAAVLVAVDQPTYQLRWSSSLSLHLAVDGTARAPLVLVPLVGLAVVTYALGGDQRRGGARLAGLLVAFVGAMELLLIAADFLSLLIAWELVGLISWALIAHDWRTDAPSQAAHAFVSTRFGDLGLLAAAGAAFAATGELGFAALPRASGGFAHVVVAGVLVAAVAKSAQVPLAPWLFSAMVGPTPVSALLHSATMVAAGAYLLARLHPFLSTVAWFQPVTITVGLTTAVSGGIVAIVQPEVKQLLAASTSAQYGLMLVAVGSGYPAVAIAHLVAHGLFKALLFVSAGVAIDAAGTHHLARMRLGGRMRLIAGVTAIGALALAAVPPLGAAWTKEQVVAAGTHVAPWIGGLVVIAGGLSAFYAARFFLLVYGHPSARRGAPATNALGERSAAQFALLLLAIATLAIGLLWTPWGEERLQALVGGDLPGGAAWELPASVAAVALGGFGAAAADRRRRLATLGDTSGWQRVGRWFELPALSRVALVDPTLALARAAARFDDRVVDAGATAVAGAGARMSRAAARFDDRVVDAGVRIVAGLGVSAARLIDRISESGIDAAVEGIARLTGGASRNGRRLQSGQTHRYYTGIAAAIALGAVVLVGATLSRR